jgi:hypothetical protein
MSSSPLPPGVDLRALLVLCAHEIALLVAAELAPTAPSAAPTFDPLVKREELARLLATSPATIDRLVRSGMPFVPLGDVRRFDAVACRAWLESRGQQPARETVKSAITTAEQNTPTGVRCLSRRRTR